MLPGKVLLRMQPKEFEIALKEVLPEIEFSFGTNFNKINYTIDFRS